ERRLELGLKFGQRLQMQRLLGERRPKGMALVRVLRCERQTPPHRGDRAERIPGPGNLQHWRNRFDAVRRTRDQLCESSVQLDLGGRQHLGAEFFLEAVDPKSVEFSVRAAKLQVEQGQALSAA